MIQAPKPAGNERREFFRLNFNAPLQFKSYSIERPGKSQAQPAVTSEGSSKNISPSGILFQTRQNPPTVSSVLWMNLDLRTLNICQEIEKRALIFNNGLLGRVVRVEEDPENESLYDVGVCFLTQDQRNSREVKQLLSELSQ